MANCSLKCGWVFKLKEQVLRIENFRVKVWGSFRLGLSFLKEPWPSLLATPQLACSVSVLCWAVFNSATTWEQDATAGVECPVLNSVSASI